MRLWVSGMEQVASGWMEGDEMRVCGATDQASSTRSEMRFSPLLIDLFIEKRKTWTADFVSPLHKDPPAPEIAEWL